MVKNTTLFAVCLMGILCALALIWYLNTSTGEVDVKESALVASVPFSLGKSLPVRLIIPKLNLNATFTAPVGLLPTGEIAVPEAFESVAYYQYAPTPGEIGPAVVLGYSQSLDDKGSVFSSLGRMSKGDTLAIERMDGSIATFAVTKIDRLSNNRLSTEEVYGDINFSGVRLITCTAESGADESGCIHDLIVFGQLIATSTVSN